MIVYAASCLKYAADLASVALFIMMYALLHFACSIKQRALVTESFIPSHFALFTLDRLCISMPPAHSSKLHSVMWSCQV